MTPVDRKEFVEVVVGFAELKRQQLSGAAIELYWRSLQHWPLEEFRKAAEHLLRTCEFMPLPKDFEDLRKAGRPTAGEAWLAVLNYARVSYSSSDAEPEDELARRAVRALGGYRAIAMSPTDKTHFLEKRFCEHYEQMQAADDVRDAVPEIAYSDHPALKGPQPASALLPRISRP